MAINKLPTIAEYWKVDNLIGNDGIQNTMIQNRFCEILQNPHFADNRKDNKKNRHGFQDETSDKPLKFEIFQGNIEWL